MNKRSGVCGEKSEDYSEIEREALSQLSPKEKRVNVFIGYAWEGELAERDENWNFLKELFNKYKKNFDSRFKDYEITLSVQRLRGTHTENNFESISAKIAEADILAFDINNKEATGCNFNVLLELGMAIALKKKPFIFVNENIKSKIPSDLNGYFFTYYSDNGKKDAIHRLKDFRGFINKYVALMNDSARQKIERIA